MATDCEMQEDLPTFRGYIVDEDLLEFRKVTWRNRKPNIHIIPFSSRKGGKLLHEWVLMLGRTKR
jgi:hypothetical protein